MAGHRVTAEHPVQPIFIVGMPGLGTTVHEQIFAAHPQCHGGGERRTVRAAIPYDAFLY